MSEQKKKNETIVLDKIELPNLSYVGRSEIGGYGVFSKKFIKKDTVIDRSIFVFSGYRAKDQLSVSRMMRKWLWPFPCGCDECKFRGKQFIFGSGQISLYNHSENYNVKLAWKPENRLIEIVTTKDVKANSELLINYGKDYTLWGEI